MTCTGPTVMWWGHFRSSFPVIRSPGYVGDADACARLTLGGRRATGRYLGHAAWGARGGHANVDGDGDHPPASGCQRADRRSAERVRRARPEKSCGGHSPGDSSRTGLGNALLGTPSGLPRVFQKTSRDRAQHDLSLDGTQSRPIFSPNRAMGRVSDPRFQHLSSLSETSATSGVQALLDLSSRVRPATSF